MADNGVSDYFISDIEDDFDDEDLLTAPVVVPVRTPEPAVTTSPEPVEPRPEPEPEAQERPSAEPSMPEAPPAEAATEPGSSEPEASADATAEPVAEGSRVSTGASSRETQLARALDALMESNHDIQASALVSLDGFTMASALPTGMQEDRVGAMSAAILGLGERAAAELGRGTLAQVYIEGADGIVVLISAGGRAVLTALASAEARLGLVLYDMRDAAEDIGSILA